MMRRPSFSASSRSARTWARAFEVTITGRIRTCEPSNQTKDKVRGKWRKLTSDDLDAIHGRRDLLESTIEQRYGFAPDYVHKEVDDWFRWQNWRSSHFTTSILNHRSVKNAD
jgi:uncharacterized protein YjbJ (UPF0337 family)